MRANYYSLTGVDQAGRYLAVSVLGNRLRNCVRAMLTHRGKSAWDIPGSPDNWKLKSCLTLFKTAATNDGDQGLFQAALQQFYSGERYNKDIGAPRR
jgi:uncharacterized protein (DUF1810 family)